MTVTLVVTLRCLPTIAANKYALLHTHTHIHTVLAHEAKLTNSKRVHWCGCHR